jgi:hypothetical protein
MKTPNLLVCLFVCLIAIPAVAQQPIKKNNPEAKEAGLKKIAGGSAHKNLNIDVNIDEEALEASIEVAIKNAMESLRVLEQLEIHIEPISIDLSNLNLLHNPIVIDIPHIEENVEPIDIDLDEMDFDMDIDMDFDIDNDFDWDNDNGNDDDNDWSFDKDKKKEKEKLKEEKDKPAKPTKQEKDKAKGLKKIN